MEIKPDIETFAKILVIGVGGGGGSTVNAMVASKIRGVEFIAVNTDAQALHHSRAPMRMHIGKSVTRGLGAGMNPEMGRKAAEENIDELKEILKDTDMVFIAAGLGGGTGSGAAPIIASVAKEMGALTIGVVTKPFPFEGKHRMMIAEKAHEELSSKVDTIITVPNERILQVIEKKTGLMEAFDIVDDVLRQAVQGISELVTVHGVTNVDFADVKSIMKDAGSALMGIGYGSGDNRAADAAKAAINSPLLEVSIDGAKGILFTITGGKDLGMFELNEAAHIITEKADPSARIIYGTIIDENMKDEVRVTVIAAGFGKGGGQRTEQSSGHQFQSRSSSMSSSSGNSPLSRLSQQSRYESTPAQSTPTPSSQPSFSSNQSFSQPAPSNSSRANNFNSVNDSIMNEPVKSQESDLKSDSIDQEDLDIPAFIRKKMM